MTGIPVCCMACGAQACVNRVTANLQCGCGSSDVDIYDGSPGQLQAIAAARASQLSFLAFMREGTSTPVGTEVPGWNVYQGPPPSPNPWGHAKSSLPCPVCHGSKFDVQDGGVCRECGGSGTMTPTTSVAPAPLVAKHPDSSTQTSVPFMGRRKQATAPSIEEVLKETAPGYSDRGGKGPKDKSAEFSWNNTDTHYPRADSMSPATRYREPHDYTEPPKGHFAMPGAACPNCGQDPTHLVKDHKEDAWWRCPNCGPLANIDKNPSVDPYEPPEEFLPDGSKFKERTATYRGKSRGSLLRMALATQESNPGLTERQVLFLARNAVSRYLETP
jgi:hypothetical protein